MSSVSSDVEYAQSIDSRLITLQDDLFEFGELENDIPSTVQSQTLQEILNEPDETNEDWDAKWEDLSSHASSSAEGLLGPSVFKRVAKADSKLTVLLKLRSVSSQLISAKERLNAGTPTCMTTSPQAFVAIGMSSGLTFVFDSDEVLKCCLGWGTTFHEVCDQGQISALDFSADSKRLLAGHARGLITVYDIANSRLLLRLNDVHSVGTAVLHLYVTDNPSIAVCSDSGGSVFKLNFRHVLSGYQCSSQCLFSGCKGEACCVLPCRPRHEGIYDTLPVINDCMMLAIATLTKLIVVKLKPVLKILTAFGLPGSYDSLPFVAWHYFSVKSKHESKDYSEPVIAFGRSGLLYLYQVSIQDYHKIQFNRLISIELNYTCINIALVNKHQLLLLDNREQIHLYDIDRRLELESSDLSNCGLIYQVSDWKGLANGGNVSLALAHAGEYACYHSMRVHKNKVTLLGVDSLYSISLRNWLERINSLISTNNYPDAILLALDLYESNLHCRTLNSSNIDSNNFENRWRSIVLDKAIDLVLTYLEVSITSSCPKSGKIDYLYDHYKFVLPLCFESLLRLNILEQQIQEVWDRCCSCPVAQNVFLEILEEAVVSGRFTNLSPTFVQALLAYLEQEGMLNALEQCVVRTSVDRLDLHQVMKLCKAHQLYDALLYVYNRAFNDYITPLKEMLDELRICLDRGDILTDEEIKLGNKSFLYISCCLCERAYPIGELPPKTSKQVSKDVYNFITQSHSSQSNRTLEILLRFDCQEFLNVLEMAFGEWEIKMTDKGLFRVQSILDILLDSMISNSCFSELDLGALFTFTARLLVRRQDLVIVPSKLQQLLEGLCCNESTIYWSSQWLAKQQALLDLMQINRKILPDTKILLQLALRAKFWHVCEIIYWKHREYSNIIDCYLCDPLRKEQIFAYLNKVLLSKDALKSEILEMKSKIMRCVTDLAKISSRGLAEIVEEHQLNINDIMHNIEKEIAVEVQLAILTNILDIRTRKGHNNFSDNPNDNSVIVDLYVRLLCGFNSNELLPFLKEYSSACSDSVLQICLKFGSIRAVVYILEQKNQIKDAYEHLLCIVRQLILSEQFNRYVEAVNDLVAFNVRHSNHMSMEERKNLWFPLLDVLMEAYDVRTDFVRNSLNNVINAMLPFVDSAELMTRLFEGCVLENGQWTEIFPLIESIFNSYSYQEILFAATCRIINSELCQVLNRIRTKRCTAVKCESHKCAVCHTDEYMLEHKRLIVFDCGHSCHFTCLESQSSNLNCLKCPCCCGARNQELIKKKYLPPILPSDCRWIKPPGPKIPLAEDVGSTQRSFHASVNTQPSAASASNSAMDVTLNLSPPVRFVSAQR